MVPRNRAAFTLVELLVVITIIGMLVALLMPAVMRARERARIVQCANNQGQLGKAMLGYALAKKHFPGYANTLKNKRVSWAPLLLPYLERSDLWEGAGNWRAGGTPAVNIPTFVCPSDTVPDYGLSYVVNVGKVLPANGDAGTGLFRNLNVANPDYVSTTEIKSTSQHPMIAESPAETFGRAWTLTDPSNGPISYVNPQRFGFIWPAPPAPESSAMIVYPTADASLGFLVPIHNGLINVTFCDGHTEGLTDDTEMVYNRFDFNDPK